MPQVKMGDTVRVHYTGKLEDGTVFDSSVDREPIEFTLGESQVIPGFEQAVLGMDLGETKSSTIPAEEAYGPYLPERLLAVSRAQFPPHIQPHVGQRLQVNQGDQSTMSVTVAEVSDDQVILDANHPLAGRDLTFDIQLMEIVS